MLIKLKNKDTLIIDDFKFKCCVGKKGIKINKIEGDKSTPSGTFKIGDLYYRPDRYLKPYTKLKKKWSGVMINLVNFIIKKYY